MNSNRWPSHWLFGDQHSVFRQALTSVCQQAADDLCQANTRENLGGEDTQCQHFFTKVFAQMQMQQDQLTQALLCCSRVKDPVIEMRYYRSVPRRSRKQRGPQLVESETGADFALTLQVDVPDQIRADRSVLGQAKLVDNKSIPIRAQQLDTLIAFAGTQSAAYLMWGPGYLPTVITAENIRTLGRVNRTNRLTPDVLRYGKPFAEFLVESFIGLWFGKDFDRRTIAEPIPKESPTALYMMLHGGTPPPNVLHLGVMSTQSCDLPPGVYVSKMTDMKRDEEQNGDRR